MHWQEPTAIGGGVAATMATAKPPHMTASQTYSGAAEQAVAPSSWGIGTFH